MTVSGSHTTDNNLALEQAFVQSCPALPCPALPCQSVSKNGQRNATKQVDESGFKQGGRLCMQK